MMKTVKTLLASALAVGVAVADSAYYIGNYTANGQVNLIPYPLGVCVPTGAVSGFVYSIFTCSGDDIQQKKYAMTDTTCSDDYTTITFAKKVSLVWQDLLIAMAQALIWYLLNILPVATVGTKA